LRLAARPEGASGPSRRRSHAGTLFWLRATIVIVAVLIADRLTKQAVESSVTPGEERSFLPGIQIVHTHNNGVAFGLLGGSHVYLTVALSLIVVLVLVLFGWRIGRGPTWIPIGMIVGGALGNVIDRLRFGSVTDFIKLPLGWPPFNLADACITVGVLLLALLASRPAPSEPGKG
jgi:signal peptidase II